MKKIVAFFVIMAAVVLFVGQAMAIDIEALDKVSVLMTRSEGKGPYRRASSQQ